MTLPKFTAELSLGNRNRRYSSAYNPMKVDGLVILARPLCSGCDDAFFYCLEQCGGTPSCETSCSRAVRNCYRWCLPP
jgi:hypothetical protein